MELVEVRLDGSFELVLSYFLLSVLRFGNTVTRGKKKLRSHIYENNSSVPDLWRTSTVNELFYVFLVIIQCSFGTWSLESIRNSNLVYQASWINNCLKFAPQKGIRFHSFCRKTSVVFKWTDRKSVV